MYHKKVVKKKGKVNKWRPIFKFLKTFFGNSVLLFYVTKFLTTQLGNYK